METTEPTETLQTPEQEKTQIALMAKPSILNIAKNKEAYEALRDECTGITLPEFKDPEFKKTHKKVTELSGRLVKARTAATKLVKQEKDTLKQVINLIEAEGDKLIAITAESEKEIKSLKETADGLVEEEKQEIIRQAEEKKQVRIATLFDLGMKFNGAYYEMGDLSLTSIQVTQYSEAQFEGFVSQAKVVYEAEQLRIAEEAEKAESERLAQQAEHERLQAEYETEQLRLRTEAADRQKELDKERQEKELMRFERTEHRVETLRRHDFIGDLKVGTMTRSSFILKAEFIVDATKAEWDAKMGEFEAYLIEISTPKETSTKEAPVVLDTQIRPLNGSAIKFTEEQKESILHDVLVIEEAVKGDMSDEFPADENHTIATTLVFHTDCPYIDTPVGKSTLRIYVEQFLDEAQDGLTKENVAATGSIGDELLFMVIKPKA